MSNLSITPMRAYYDTRLNQEDILLLSIVCSHTDIDGFCYPGLARLSGILSPIMGRETPFSISSISKRMLRLELYGYLTNEFQRKTANGSFKSNQYKVIYDAILPLEFSRLAIQASVENASTENQASLENPLEEITTNVPLERPNLNELSETRVSEPSPKPAMEDRFGARVKNMPEALKDKVDHPAIPKTLEPTTNLGRYLAEQSVYGNRKWTGFSSAGERDDWLKMEESYSRDDIRKSIDWACGQMRFGKAKLVHNIIMAVSNNKRAVPTDREQSLDPGKVL